MDGFPKPSWGAFCPRGWGYLPPGGRYLPRGGGIYPGGKLFALGGVYLSQGEQLSQLPFWKLSRVGGVCPWMGSPSLIGGGLFASVGCICLGAGGGVICPRGVFTPGGGQLSQLPFRKLSRVRGVCPWMGSLSLIGGGYLPLGGGVICPGEGICPRQVSSYPALLPPRCGGRPPRRSRARRSGSWCCSWPW